MPHRSGDGQSQQAADETKRLLSTSRGRGPPARRRGLSRLDGRRVQQRPIFMLRERRRRVAMRKKKKEEDWARCQPCCRARRRRENAVEKKRAARRQRGGGESGRPERREGERDGDFSRAVPGAGHSIGRGRGAVRGGWVLDHPGARRGEMSSVPPERARRPDGVNEARRRRRRRWWGGGGATARRASSLG